MNRSDLKDSEPVTPMPSHANGASERSRHAPTAVEGIDAWNATQARFDDDKCIHELFEAQAAATPNAVALVYGDVGVSYAELNGRANRLAHFLRANAAGAGSRVGICMERSVEMVVALLGVLKSGAAYVPLDPIYPGERLEYMAADAAVRLVLCQRHLAASVPRGVEIFELDDRWAQLEPLDVTNIATGAAGLDSRSAAYVIYTSGSTGRPKGVMNPHRGVVNRLQWSQGHYGLDASDRVLQKTPYSFDVSVWEFFWPLSAGARLVLARPGGHQDAAYLSHLIEREGITVSHFVPSMLSRFLEHGATAQWSSLRRVMCSGEELPAAVQKQFAHLLPNTSLHNLYGPTEASIEATFYDCRADDTHARVPIGRPIANVRIHILDESGRPAAVGDVGELHIAGVGVALGYLNLPELTAARFVADPFAEDPAARMYKSGDLARWRPDGQIEYLGRNDFQVKVRGFRIELGEIEARLMEHADVSNAVVVARAAGEGERQLVAYYTGAEVGAARLREHLRAALPEYMLPAAFAHMDSLPVTSNGKLDRDALPAPDKVAYTLREYEPAHDGFERQLGQIWCEILGSECVGRNDHFFEMGGSSLQAMRMVSRVKQSMGLDISLHDVFAAPVLSEAARQWRAAGRSALAPIPQVERTAELPMSYAQQGLWLQLQHDRASGAYHVPLRMRLCGRLDEGALRRALDFVLLRHEALRTTFGVDGSMPVQRIGAARPFSLRTQDVRGSDDVLHRSAAAAADEVGRPFDLESGPLARGLLLREADDAHVLLLTFHHIVCDGWSIDVLLGDLAACYRAFVQSIEPQLPHAAVQYADYALWHRRWLDAGTLQRQSEHWKVALAGAPPLLTLPSDRSRPQRRDYAGDFVSVDIDAGLTADLKALCARRGATLFMGVLTAWAVVLSRLAGQDDVVVGSPVANRARGDIDGLVGFLVNMLSLRIDLSGAPSVAELLDRVRTAALSAQLHQDLPFERVVEAVRPQRDPSYSPIFQATLAWETAPPGALSMPGLSVELLDDDAYRAAQYDITLALQERGAVVRGRLLYATALFDRESVEYVRGCLLAVLRHMVAHESDHIDEMPMPDPPRALLQHEVSRRSEVDVTHGRDENSEYEASQGDVETALARIWSQVLSVPRIGRHDNFFRLGGHSLLAMQLMLLLRQEGFDASADDLWSHPTLAQMALRLAAPVQSNVPAIVPVNRASPPPLSSGQQRLWFLEQIEGLGETYHVPLRLRLRGALDLTALRDALGRIVARHEILRTTFDADGGLPIQRIAPATTAPFTLTIEDLRAHSDARDERERLIARHIAAPFNLRAGPLLRAVLLRETQTEHTLLVTMHHIVSDGWSVGVFLAELGALYGAFVEKREDPLPVLNIQYADYSAWQRDRVESHVLRTQGEYWKERLRHAPALLELPWDRLRPARQSHAGDYEPFSLSRELTTALKAFSRRHDATMFMTLLAAWSIVLSRLSGQKDVVIGSPVANRGHAQTENLIGLFVNALALRVDLSDAPSVRELISRVKETTASAQLNQDVPFERVVEMVQPPRSLSHSPVFQVLLNWQPEAEASPQLPGVDAVIVQDALRGVAKYDLTLYLLEQDGAIVGGTAYATSLFDAGTVRRFHTHLANVFAAMVSDEQCNVEKLPLLGLEEREWVLDGLNRTPVPYVGDEFLHELFEAQAARTPEDVAVVHEGDRLTYRQLDEAADRVAQRLLQLGAEPEKRIGICAQRGPGMIAALLGVMKAGAAFVPLDPTYPPQRLAFMIADSAPVAILVDAHTAPQLLGAGIAAPLLDLTDALRAEHTANRHDARAAGLKPEHLAYVMYTSGSTGAPKGVMIEQRGFPNLVRWYIDELELCAGDCMLIATSLSFDLTQRNLLGPLLVGARLCLASNFFDAHEIVALTVRERVSVTNITPSMLRALIDAGLDAARGGLRQVVLGGEGPRAHDLLRMPEPRPRFVNVYGPTECTGVVAWHRLVEPLQRYLVAPVPLGDVLPNARVYVLDQHQQPVPIGVRGEIYIGGIGVSRGYLNRAELSSQRFLSDPFARGPGARMYRTGDVGRWRADGDLEYLGRDDFQVKIRGFRIELGEIESSLLRHAGVDAATVAALDDGHGGKRLVAYYTTDPTQQTPSPDALREHLHASLPDYMVPVAYVRLDTMPLTPNGKLDRKALPQPDGNAYRKREFESPLGDAEQAIAAAWSLVLKIDSIGRHDNFFDLGGHSLMAIQLVSLLQERDLNFSAVDFWTSPTIAQLATSLRERGRLPFGNSAVPIRKGGAEPPLFCMHDGLTQLMYVPVLIQSLNADIPVYGLPAQPKSETRLSTLKEQGRRMLHMIRDVQPDGPYRIAGYSYGGMLAYETATQLVESGQTVEFLGLLDTRCHVAGTSAFEISLDDLTDDQQLLMFLRYEFDAYSDMTQAIGELQSGVRHPSFEAVTQLLHDRCLMPKPYDRLPLAQLRYFLRCGLSFLIAKVRHVPMQLPIPVSVFASQDSLGADPRLHWGGVIPQHLISVVPTAGTHFSMLLPPNAEQIAEKFAQEFRCSVERARGSATDASGSRRRSSPPAPLRRRVKRPHEGVH